jgi:hypothetical protein
MVISLLPAVGAGPVVAGITGGSMYQNTISALV